MFENFHLQHMLPNKLRNGLLSVLQFVAVCVAVCCNVLQCVAVYCSVVQCGAIWCNMLQCVTA